MRRLPVLRRRTILPLRPVQRLPATLLPRPVRRLRATLLSGTVRLLPATVLSGTVRRLSAALLRLAVWRLGATLLRLSVLGLRTLLLPLPRSIVRARGQRPLLLAELSRLSVPPRLTEAACLISVARTRLIGVGQTRLELARLLRPPLLRLLGLLGVLRLRLLRRTADRLPRFCEGPGLLPADLLPAGLLRIRLLPSVRLRTASRRLQLLTLTGLHWLARHRPTLQQSVLCRPRLPNGRLRLLAWRRLRRPVLCRSALLVLCQP